jgi:Ca2+-binding EF-hand superfamily protein
VDVPSSTLLESAYQKLAKHTSLEDFFTTWRGLGNIISETLLRGRGSRIENFGTFTYNIRNEPCFALSREFAQANRVAQKNIPVISNTVSNSKFNTAALAENTGQPARLVQHVIEAVVTSLADYVKSDCSVCLAVHPVGVFVVTKNECMFRFEAEFNEKMQIVLNGGDASAKKKVEVKKSEVARKAVYERPKETRPSSSASSRGGVAAASPRPGSAASRDGFAPGGLSSTAWPPAAPGSAGRNRPGAPGSGGRPGAAANKNNGNLLNPAPPTPPTPRLSKSEQLKLKADNLKAAHKSMQNNAFQRKGAREISSNARKAELEATVAMVRNKIIVRGGMYGIRGLGRLLKSMDDDKSGELNKNEMKNGFVDCGIKVSSQQLEDLFVFFDKDGSGSVSFEEFMDGLRGDMPASRLLVINQAYDHIDEDNNGDISISEISKRFRCQNHPAILDKSATKEQVLKEFLSQWDKARADGTIDREDFISFYWDVGASITDEDDFEFMMTDTWGFEVVKFGEDGEALESSLLDGFNPPANAIPEDPYAEDMKVVAGLLYTPPCNFEKFIERCHASQIQAVPTMTTGEFGVLLKRMSTEPLRPQRIAELVDSVQQTMRTGERSVGMMINIQNLHSILNLRHGGGSDKSGSIIDIVKGKLLQRAGSDGLRAVSKVMNMMDDDGSKTLTKMELKNGLADWGLPLNLMEIDSLFTFFDRDGSGTISFDEFLKGLRGPMSERRRKLVDMAFDVVDKTGDGQVTLDDLKDVYDCSQHPGVLDGSTTVEAVLSHFVDMWDQGDKDGIVTRDEFAEYYADVGASIDGDDYFELMIRNAWHIAGGEGASANSANRKVYCKFKDGVEELVLIISDLGLGDDEKKILAQVNKEGAGKAHGGVVAVDIKGVGFDKKKKEDDKKPAAKKPELGARGRGKK